MILSLYETEAVSACAKVMSRVAASCLSDSEINTE